MKVSSKWQHSYLNDITKCNHLHIAHVCDQINQSINKLAPIKYSTSWWRHQMETFSTLLAICAGNSPVPGEFPTQRPVTRSFDVYFDLRPNKRLSKQSWGWWFETQSRPLWRHRNVFVSNDNDQGSIIRNCQWKKSKLNQSCVSLTHGSLVTDICISKPDQCLR